MANSVNHRAIKKLFDFVLEGPNSNVDKIRVKKRNKIIFIVQSNLSLEYRQKRTGGKERPFFSLSKCHIKKN